MIDVSHHFWSSRVARESSLESLSEKKNLKLLRRGIAIYLSMKLELLPLGSEKAYMSIGQN